ncbi:imm11 family protein [Luteimonas sp. WGS1318]|uniref:imm11 family protein n=1 Tax=Luteimonas sp. WGS1318 TaxID=3366815 RepID=UPI00372CEEED
MDYSLAGYASVPVLSESAVQSLLGIPEVDAPYEHVVFAPINIEPQSARRNYFLMIIETQIDCVDEERSDFIKFDSKDPVRPDLSGSYQSFFNLVVDPKKIGDSHIFRVMGYIGAIVVSEEVRDRFERAGVVGAIFESVNGDRVTVA